MMIQESPNGFHGNWISLALKDELEVPHGPIDTEKVLYL
jgi:hypothetical protein